MDSIDKHDDAEERLDQSEEYFTLSHTTRTSEDQSEDNQSNASSNDQFLILSDDHLTDLSEDNLDSQGLPIDRKDLERAIQKYIRLIRLEHDSEEKRKKLIVRLCQLRIRLNQMNEEIEEKFLNGHRLSPPGQLQHQVEVASSPGSCSSLVVGTPPSAILIPTTTSPSSSLVCDVCLRRQNMISMLPPILFKTYQQNVILTCDFCDFMVHRNCITYPMVSYF